MFESWGRGGHRWGARDRGREGGGKILHQGIASHQFSEKRAPVRVANSAEKFLEIRSKSLRFGERRNLGRTECFLMHLPQQSFSPRVQTDLCSLQI